jgi:hypothetical protein
MPERENEFTLLEMLSLRLYNPQPSPAAIRRIATARPAERGRSEPRLDHLGSKEAVKKSPYTVLSKAPFRRQGPQDRALRQTSAGAGVRFMGERVPRQLRAPSRNWRDVAA